MYFKPKIIIDKLDKFSGYDSLFYNDRARSYIYLTNNDDKMYAIKKRSVVLKLEVPYDDVLVKEFLIKPNYNYNIKLDLSLYRVDLNKDKDKNNKDKRILNIRFKPIIRTVNYIRSFEKNIEILLFKHIVIVFNMPTSTYSVYFVFNFSNPSYIYNCDNKNKNNGSDEKIYNYLFNSLSKIRSLSSSFMDYDYDLLNNYNYNNSSYGYYCSYRLEIR